MPPPANLWQKPTGSVPTRISAQAAVRTLLPNLTAAYRTSCTAHGRYCRTAACCSGTASGLRFWHGDFRATVPNRGRTWRHFAPFKAACTLPTPQCGGWTAWNRRRNLCAACLKLLRNFDAARKAACTFAPHSKCRLLSVRAAVESGYGGDTPCRPPACASFCYRLFCIR